MLIGNRRFSALENSALERRLRARLGVCIRLRRFAVFALLTRHVPDCPNWIAGYLMRKPQSNKMRVNIVPSLLDSSR